MSTANNKQIVSVFDTTGCKNEASGFGMIGHELKDSVVSAGRLLSHKWHALTDVRHDVTTQDRVAPAATLQNAASPVATA
jgi:hypothetical protein